MAKPQSAVLSANFAEDYKQFLKKYLFRLLGLPSIHFPIMKCTKPQPCKDVVSRYKGRIYFSANNQQVYWTKDDPIFTDDNLQLARVVIKAYFQFSEYRMEDTKKHNNLVEHQRKEKIYNMAVQVGICQWIAGETQGSKAELLFNILEKWSVKTYEGRNVTMGFIIDPSKISNTKLPFNDWISFLKDDCSAVLSDCIHTVFELDMNCNLIRHCSITESGKLPERELNKQVPLRFMHMIQAFVPEETGPGKSNRVGIFLLANGDIILAKNGVTRFVKRNLQWLNLSYSAFQNATKKFMEDTYGTPVPKEAKELLLEIYASILDVSFSHTGGIISIVGPEWEAKVDGVAPVDTVLNKSDNLLLPELPKKGTRTKAAQGATLEEKNENSQEEKKRTVKRLVIRQLLNNQKFDKLDRKLRSELIALDGACILKKDGSVFSFGAIIQNDSGSSGGGRAAAAKKLSQYGMAIKVSTDGYIEVYVKTVPVYTVK